MNEERDKTIAKIAERVAFLRDIYEQHSTTWDVARKLQELYYDITEGCFSGEGEE